MSIAIVRYFRQKPVHSWRKFFIFDLKRYVIDKTGLELKDNGNPAVIKVKFKI